jgi:hypothetical protein
MKLKILAITLLLPIYSHSNELEERIINAINHAAKHAAEVLLDDEGKSRCDYHLTEGVWYPYEEAWHTGQVIYGLLEAYRITGNEQYLNASKRAGNWWTSLEITDHPKLNGMLMAVHGDHAGDVIVFATVSDGTAGLFRLYNATGIEKYARIPTNAGAWMLENMCLLDKGVCYDSVDPVTGEVLTENSPFWPEEEEITLYNVARPNTEGSLFLDMYRYTGIEKYKEAFLILCESLLEKQGPEGLWMDFTPNHKDRSSFHPRFNLWYAESLIYAFELTGDRRYLEAAKKTAQQYARVQNFIGTIFYQNFLDGTRNENSITGSAIAFAGIIWLRLLEHGVGDEFLQNIDRSINWMLNNQFAYDHPDENLRGAILNTRVRNRFGKVWIVNRDIGTSFGLRFMAKYLDYMQAK